MKHIKSYTKHNEGILSKAKELVNYSKKADELCSKYIKMIYDDWNKNKDLFRMTIRVDGKNYNFKYKITDDKFGSPNANAMTGNHAEDSLEIEFSFRDNILTSNYDKTQARMEVEKFKSYLGMLCVVGKNLNTGELIYDENGVRDKSYTYLNVPSKEVKKMIQFFIGKFKEKYPTIGTGTYKNYHSMAILEIDKELGKKLSDKSKSDWKKSGDDHEKKVAEQTKIVEDILGKLKIEKIQITDLFYEIEDKYKSHIDYDQAAFINGSLYLYSPKGGDRPSVLDGRAYTKFSLDSRENTNKLGFVREDIPLRDNVPYHRLVVELGRPALTTDTEDEYGRLKTKFDVKKFQEDVDRVLIRCHRLGLRIEVKEMLDIRYDEEGGQLRDDLKIRQRYFIKRVTEKMMFNPDYAYVIYLYEK